MILNISGRTDIVGFYSKWFMNRYKEGFVDVRNPYYQKLVSRIYFKDVDLLVFCSKNPLPILKEIDKIKQKIIFHITLTPYQKDLEPNVPPKGMIINAIKELSKKLGKENIYVRYDPILINDKYDLEYHKKSFNSLCNKLNGYIDKIIISFIDLYKNVLNNCNYLKLKNIDLKFKRKISLELSKIASNYNMSVQSCCEGDLSNCGILNKECLSKKDAFKLTGKKYPIWKERPCKCVQMVDIGSYNTCNHLCKYCYANYDETKIKQNILDHHDDSSLLIGYLKDDDIIKVRKK